jgi:hypothetical protein
MSIAQMSVHEKMHLALTALWVILMVPAILWWKHSVPFLVAVSVYANIAGHYAAYEAARGERRSPTVEGQE